ncbi:FAD-dependent oxidoreductase [uncultured Sulfitobacter sp.]|uniref:NAD(P)/FAD-dependent oxidoreductase n=1 Tax=uncultured Sulfitobacter sp. TaxID=191468 RepID=UPI00262098B6|nr:FAD-dependent oxidoreductase [uncultured Sulfitobacter sp.]
MKRIFGAYAYGDGPRADCWWDETSDSSQYAPFAETGRTDVAIIGAGFTGISAALHLAQAGVSVTVLDARHVGWGASGRNGGFCCLGGGMASDAALDHRFGKAGRIAYHRTELAAVEMVAHLIETYGINADRHSRGETVLAHRAKDIAALRAHAVTVEENYGVPHYLHGADDLDALGMGGPFHGGLTVEAGFGLNPRKYIDGLARAAVLAGARIYEKSSVSSLARQQGGTVLAVNGHSLTADHVIIATNGYSSDDLPDWLAARYLPSQSNVIVTRPLTDDELAAAGWTTDQMVYDTRNLLHYFRLMPDRRFLFGMRGGLLTGAQAEMRAAAKIRQDFEAMFPAWRGVETAHGWSGMVCLARDMLPFVGQVPDHSGLWAALCYHGNGVAMGTYSGALLAQLVQGRTPDMPYPAAMQTPLRRFELGRFRRAVMPLAYAGLMLADR